MNFLQALRKANILRQSEWPGNDKIDLTFRALEFANEAGEVAGAVKKYVRHKHGIGGEHNTIQDIADEIGDAIITLDLLACELDIDIEDATRSKFNKTSDKLGMRTRLTRSS